MTRKPRQRSCLSSCMFCFPANAKSQDCLITKQTQRRWSWNVCGCPYVFLGKLMVSPLVPWGWWSDSAWLFLSHLQECVRCHFGSAKQCWMPAQTKLLAMGTAEVLMREAWGRGCESSQWQKRPWGVCLCLCPSLSTPLLHLCWAPVEAAPPAPAKGRETCSPFRGAGWAEAPAATLLAPKRDNCCSSALPPAIHLLTSSSCWQPYTSARHCWALYALEVGTSGTRSFMRQTLMHDMRTTK